MSRMNRILVATDFSERADSAVQRAALLAASHGVTLELLHVIYDLPLTRAKRVLTAMPDGLENQIMKPVSEHLEQLAGKLRKQHNISVETNIITGRPATAIAERTGASPAIDMIAIGPHRKAMLRNAIMGTTAQNLVRTAGCNTLVVKNEPRGDYKRVLVPVDFSDHARQAVIEALRIAPDASIHVEHVFEVPYEHYALYGAIAEDAAESVRSASEQQAREDMDEFMQRLAPEIGRREVHAEVHPGYPAADIDRRAEELDADLIVMGAFGQSDITYALLGSVTVSVMLNSPRDLLAIRV